MTDPTTAEPSCSQPLLRRRLTVLVPLVAALAVASCTRDQASSSDAVPAAPGGSVAAPVELWNVDPQDWARPGVDAIVSNVIEHAGPGDVVLMHDGGGDRDQTIAALGEILEHFSSRGVSFTPIPGC